MTDSDPTIALKPIGRVIGGPTDRTQAPKQGREADLTARIEIFKPYLDGLDGLKAGDWIWVLLWFHLASRDKLRVHPRGDVSRPKRGVFALRSPTRPNPIALDPVKIIKLDGGMITVVGLDALDGTEVIDIKPYSPKVDRID